MDPCDPERLEALRVLGNSAPIARAVGMEITEIRPGRSRVVIPFSRTIMQAHGRVHGGIFGLLLDTAGYFAAASLTLSDGVTIGYTLNLLEGVRDEGLVAEAEVLRAGRVIAHADVSLWSESRRLIAKGTAAYRFFRSSGDARDPVRPSAPSAFGAVSRGACRPRDAPPPARAPGESSGDPEDSPKMESS